MYLIKSRSKRKGYSSSSKKSRKTTGVSVDDFTHKYSGGYGDIRIPGETQKVLNLQQVPYARQENTQFNRYLLEGENQAAAIQMIQKVKDVAQSFTTHTDLIDIDRLKFRPGIVSREINIFGLKRIEKFDTQFCWLEDTRFTKTGKVSINAYVLHFLVTRIIKSETTLIICSVI